MLVKLRSLASVFWISFLLLSSPSIRAQESTPKADDHQNPTADFISIACDPGAPQELRSFKSRQIIRRASYLRDTIARLRADAARHADTYSSEDQRDLNETIQELQFESNEIAAFESSGCSNMPLVRHLSLDPPQRNNESVITHIKSEKLLTDKVAKGRDSTEIGSSTLGGGSPGAIEGSGSAAPLPIIENTKDVAASGANGEAISKPQDASNNTDSPNQASNNTAKCPAAGDTTAGEAPKLEPIGAGLRISGKLKNVGSAVKIRICVDGKEVATTSTDAQGNFAASLDTPLTTHSDWAWRGDLWSPNYPSLWVSIPTRASVVLRGTCDFYSARS